MTDEEVQTLRPGDVVHRTVHPRGCSPWTISNVGQLADGTPMADTQQKYPGSGSPKLYAGAHDLARFHRAAACPTPEAALAS